MFYLKASPQLQWYSNFVWCDCNKGTTKCLF